MTVLWLILSIFILIMFRVPVAFAIIAPCVGYVLIDDMLTPGVAVQQLANTLNSFPLVAVPLFILIGFVADASGMSNRLISALLVFFGRLRGGLGYVNVGASVGFSWISGSATADASAMGSIMGRTMKRHGYTGRFATGLTGAASMIGPIMPPSIAAIIFAVAAQTSVSDMLMAGILPAFLIAAALFLYVFIYSRGKDELTSPILNAKEAGRALVGALPVVFAPVILLGGIVTGIFTPTEAAGVGAAYLILVAFATRWISLRDFGGVLTKTAEMTGRVMIIAAAGGLLAYVLARESAPRIMAEFMLNITEQPWVFLIILNVMLLIIGMFLEPTSALLISVPVIMPIALEYGIDPLHLGVIMILNLSVGLLTPPVGIVLFVLSDASETPLIEVFKGIAPLFVPLVGSLILVTYVPEISTLIPSLLQ